MSRRTACGACERDGKRSRWGKNVRIVYDPAIQMPGTPTIEGHRLAAQFIAERFFALGKHEAQDDYDLTHEEMVVTCWWAAHWGPRKLKQAWKEWGQEAGNHLWYRCINVPLPPTKSEITGTPAL